MLGMIFVLIDLETIKYDVAEIKRAQSMGKQVKLVRIRSFCFSLFQHEYFNL